MFAARAAAQRLAVVAARRTPVRKMSGDPMEAGLEMAKWTKISYGAIAFCGCLTACAFPAPLPPRGWPPLSPHPFAAPPSRRARSPPPPNPPFPSGSPRVAGPRTAQTAASSSTSTSCTRTRTRRSRTRARPRPAKQKRKSGRRRRRRHLKIRTKPYPWDCPDCNFFDAGCWKRCRDAAN